MKKNNIVISFVGLKKGIHYFDFEINDSFFDLFEHSEINKGNLFVKTELLKSSNLLTLNISINGEVAVECDNCLDTLLIPINTDNKLYVKINDELANEDNNVDCDILILSTNEQEINISQFIYESIILSLPLRKVHKGTQCNQEMLNILNQYTDKNKTEEIDPRWNELNKLLENKN